MSAQVSPRTSRFRRVALAAALALLAGASVAQSPSPAPALAAQADDPVLVSNSVTEIRRSDYQRELLRLPPESRGGFSAQPKMMLELLNRMLVVKTLATQAKAEKLDQDPDIKARLALEIQRVESQLKLQQIELAAGAEFDAKRAAWEARARELYLVDRAKYTRPEQISASHILIDQARHPSDGEKLARDAAARVRAGADFNEEAKRVSEDPSAAQNAGHLDWFGRGQMEPAFENAAFALRNVGDVSDPVQTRFGWHVIRLDGRRPAGPRSFDEVKEEILQELRAKYVAEQREAAIAKIQQDPATKLNQPAFDALVSRPDMEAVSRMLREQEQQKARGVPAPK